MYAVARMAEIVFYDGGCGLCHATVRLVVRIDRDAKFVFAPIGGAAFVEAIPAEARATLPDSVLVRRDDSSIAVKSRAVAHIMRTIGGVWSIVAVAIALVPRIVADPVYDAIAAVRRHLFPKPDGVCPVVPPKLRARFLD